MAAEAPLYALPLMLRAWWRLSCCFAPQSKRAVAVAVAVAVAAIPTPEKHGTKQAGQYCEAAVLREGTVLPYQACNAGIKAHRRLQACGGTSLRLSQG